MSQRALAEIEDVVNAAPVDEIELKALGAQSPHTKFMGCFEVTSRRLHDV